MIQYFENISNNLKYHNNINFLENIEMEQSSRYITINKTIWSLYNLRMPSSSPFNCDSIRRREIFSSDGVRVR